MCTCSWAFSLVHADWLQLSAEERGMAGAPQGDIYQVTVLESLEFVASTNVRQDLQVRAVPRATLHSVLEYVHG